MSRESSFSLTNKTRSNIPAIPFERLKDTILGRGYELSLAFVTPKDARAITQKTKKKDKPSNVLAFPLSDRSGEILICPATARAEAPEYHCTPDVFLARLFIHGCCHLAGYRHSVTMEREESRIASRFGF
ncbi:MAG: rRNA maturation RNase YbeY [Minisyncoccia bacterium]